MPCVEYLSQVRQARSEIEAMGSTAMAIASGAPHQAEALMTKGIWFPCLVDPTRQVAGALGIGKIGLGWLDPTGWWAYVRALFRGARQGEITDPLQSPGIAILDGSGTARLVDRGTTLGDYPPLADVLASLRRLVDEQRA